MISVVIPASGVGSRFGADIPKQFLDLKGKQILQRTIEAFEQMEIVDTIAVAVPNGFSQMVEDYGFSKVKHIAEGGESRAFSVLSALRALPEDTEIVLVHDGVRPFVTEDIVTAVVEAVKKHGAAVACCPVTDTIKKVGSAGKITETPNRSDLWQAQTPQGFTYDVIKNAYEWAEKEGLLHHVTDDSSLLEMLGKPVFVVESSRRNIKITTVEDVLFGEAFLEGSK